jgi:hypothetical protein
MTAQELSTILHRGLKPIIFLINNNGYTIERLILRPGSSYNDINQWRYAEAPSFLDKQDQAITYTARAEHELEDALAAARDRESLVLIEFVMSRMDAPGPLANFAHQMRRVQLSQFAAIPRLNQWLVSTTAMLMKGAATRIVANFWRETPCRDQRYAESQAELKFRSPTPPPETTRPNRGQIAP